MTTPDPPRNLPFFVAEYNGQKAAIRRNTNYQETVESIKKVFGALRHTPNEDIRLCTRFEVLDDTLRITDDLWSELVPELTLVEAIVDSPSQPHTRPSKPKPVQIFVKMNATTGRTVTMEVLLTLSVSDLKAKIEEKEKLAANRQRLSYSGRTLADEQTLANCGIQQHSTIDLFLKSLAELFE